LIFLKGSKLIQGFKVHRHTSNLSKGMKVNLKIQIYFNISSLNWVPHNNIWIPVSIQPWCQNVLCSKQYSDIHSRNENIKDLFPWFLSWNRLQNQLSTKPSQSLVGSTSFLDSTNLVSFHLRCWSSWSIQLFKELAGKGLDENVNMPKVCILIPQELTISINVDRS